MERLDRIIMFRCCLLYDPQLEELFQYSACYCDDRDDYRKLDEKWEDNTLTESSGWQSRMVNL